MAEKVTINYSSRVCPLLSGQTFTWSMTKSFRPLICRIAETYCSDCWFVAGLYSTVWAKPSGSNAVMDFYRGGHEYFMCCIKWIANGAVAVPSWCRLLSPQFKLENCTCKYYVTLQVVQNQLRLGSLHCRQINQSFCTTKQSQINISICNSW